MKLGRCGRSAGLALRIARADLPVGYAGNAILGSREAAARCPGTLFVGREAAEKGACDRKEATISAEVDLGYAVRTPPSGANHQAGFCE